MLYFLQGTLYFFKWQFHALRFITDTSPSFKGIVVYMKGFPFVQQLIYCKSHHTQPYSVTRTAVCLEGYFSKRCYILLKGLYGRIYGRQNALVLKECYAHLRVLLYTFSKECCSLYRRMLHRGMPQLPQEMPHSFKFSTMTYEKHAVALRIWVDAVLGFNNTIFFKGTICLPLQNIPYLFL